MMEKTRQEMIDLYTTPCNMFNIGCMLPYMNFTPQTLKEIETNYEAWKELNNCTKSKKEI